MQIPGRVQNGVVVFENGPVLPDGTEVVVSCDVPPAYAVRKKRRVVLPLVRSKNPGTLDLTNERIAEILEQEDIASFAKSLNRPRKS